MPRSAPCPSLWAHGTVRQDASRSRPPRPRPSTAATGTSRSPAATPSTPFTAPSCCASRRRATRSPTSCAAAACWSAPSWCCATPDTRSCPKRYTWRDGLGRKAWTENPPSWHVQAWPLRQPGPPTPTPDRPSTPAPTACATGSASARAIRAIAHRPARSPQELSKEQARSAHRHHQASVDGGRRARGGRVWLRCWSSGFLLRKVETYDTRYREPGDAYEWAMPIGGHGLRFAAPRWCCTTRRTGGTVAIVNAAGAAGGWQLRPRRRPRPDRRHADGCSRSRNAPGVRCWCAAKDAPIGRASASPSFCGSAATQGVLGRPTQRRQGLPGVRGNV